MCFVSIPVVHPFSSIDTATSWKKPHFIISIRLDFHKINSLSKAFHAFIKLMLILLSVDKMLLPRYVNWSTDFRGWPLWVQITPFCLKCNFTVKCLLLLALGYAVGIQLGLMHLYKAICLVSVCHNFCGILSAFRLLQCETIFFY